MLRLIVLVSVLFVASALAAAPVRLTEEAIRQTLVGSLLEIDTPLGIAVPVRISADGLVSGEAGPLASTLGAVHDRGRWWIDHDQLCVKWFRWFEAQTRCLTLQREGAKIYWQDAEGKSGTATIAEGHGSYSERAQMLPRRSDRSDAVCGIDLRKCNCRRLAPIADPPNRVQMLAGHAVLSTTPRHIETYVEAQRKVMDLI